jgi:membrane-bound metal-dependent hydrolase YbcI (DUF457 family)
MFVGHYGPAFLAKRADRTIPLWVLFIAVQFLDVLWAPFVLLGIEKVRIIPGITKASPLDLYYMPYTHGLIGAIVLSVLFALTYQLLARPASSRSSVITGLAVFSHWVLDLLVHRPDLPLWDNTAKVGLGLWNSPAIEIALEALLLLGGIWWCYGENLSRAKGVFVFGVVLVLIQIGSYFSPPPPSDKTIAVQAIASYIVFALIIWWLQDRKRTTPSR